MNDSTDDLGQVTSSAPEEALSLCRAAAAFESERCKAQGERDEFLCARLYKQLDSAGQRVLSSVCSSHNRVAGEIREAYPAKLLSAIKAVAETKEHRSFLGFLRTALTNVAMDCYRKEISARKYQSRHTQHLDRTEDIKALWESYVTRKRELIDDLHLGQYMPVLLLDQRQRMAKFQSAFPVATGGSLSQTCEQLEIWNEEDPDRSLSSGSLAKIGEIWSDFAETINKSPKASNQIGLCRVIRNTGESVTNANWRRRVSRCLGKLREEITNEADLRFFHVYS